VGVRSRISKGVQIDSAYMMGADFYQTFEDMRSDLGKGLPRVGIGEGTAIRRAIIDKNARIGKNARLVNDAGVTEADGPGGSYFIRDSIIIVPKNAVIADGTVI
jgi:glucose-1-phosphate adenylyltransferase